MKSSAATEETMGSGQSSAAVKSPKNHHFARRMPHARPDKPCMRIQCAIGKVYFRRWPGFGTRGTQTFA
jgi:hypothetical protein